MRAVVGEGACVAAGCWPAGGAGCDCIAGGCACKGEGCDGIGDGPPAAGCVCGASGAAAAPAGRPDGCGPASHWPGGLPPGADGWVGEPGGGPKFNTSWSNVSKASNPGEAETACFHRAIPSLDIPASRSSDNSTSRWVPGTTARTLRRPLIPYSKVTSTGQPLGSPPGRSRITVRPMAVHWEGRELSPSSTWTAIVRCPSERVTNFSVKRAGSGELRRISTTLVLRIVSGSIPSTPRLWALTLVTSNVAWEPPSARLANR